MSAKWVRKGVHSGYVRWALSNEDNGFPVIMHWIDVSLESAIRGGEGMKTWNNERVDLVDDACPLHGEDPDPLCLPCFRAAAASDPESFEPADD